ncbi:hypothetical protein SRB5_13830 [Streptomyces sp. RB5]|uniref:Uncharacterized protein n=1 Tax=Streptomyces smaragdinus TaxID=2585196 RepID=A0A7K0CCT3_9ACTN|nr:hypothetical protein [Streptomyces smaragdinus]MQY11268.1 hypothetical protein [Streptomyces smaragdinus]
MPGLPSHPDTASADDPVRPGWSRARKLTVAALLLAVLVLVAVLHLSGVIGGGEGH